MSCHLKVTFLVLFQVSFIIGTLAAPHDITITEGTGNPVLSQTTVGSGRFYFASVLFDPFAGKFRAWADASSSNHITYAESVGNNPAIWTGYTLCVGTLGPRGKAHVVQLGPNSFRMWHTGEDGTPGYQVYTFTGSDGINWVNNTPITGVADQPDSTPFADGPFEHFAPFWDGVKYYCLTNTREGAAGQTERELNWFSSNDGITWVHLNGTGIVGYDVSTLIKHPHRQNTWYAYGYQAGGEDNILSFLSTDNGATWQEDENPVPVIGLRGDYPYNPDRNYNPSAVYLGQGKWVFLRTTSNASATPVHTTSYATGVETGLPASDVENWMIY
jgi:hypothetical protein